MTAIRILPKKKYTTSFHRFLKMKYYTILPTFTYNPIRIQNGKFLHKKKKECNAGKVRSSHCLLVTEVCSGGNRRAPIKGAMPIAYTMVPNFLGQLNLTPQYPTLPSDIARNWRWTFGSSLSVR